MTTAPAAPTTLLCRRGAPRRRPVGRALALAVSLAAVALAAPAGAAPTPTSATTPRATPLSAAALIPGEQAEPTDPGPYDPGFDDLPLASNPVSPSVMDVDAESDQLGVVRDALDTAEGRRDDAIDLRDDLRRELVDLGEQRTAAVAALAQRQEEERQRGVERLAAVAVHEQRVDETAAAVVRLDEARDALRELMIAAYVNTASSTTDTFTLLSAEGDVDAALLRIGYSDRSSEGRVSDVRQRVDEHTAAEQAEADAAAAQAAAEQAERDAVAARQAAEQHIVDVDAETAATTEEEADSVEALEDREVDVLVAAAEIPAALLRADITTAGIDFPVVALDAWVKAAASAPCRVEWWMLAGISKIEGRHGTYGGGHLGARGYPTTEIIGPALNGAGAFAEIRDTDGGLWDHDTTYDRAVGPMQFIPSTWKAWGRDGDGDGIPNPHTIYDAAAAAAAYLCYGRSDLTVESQLRAAYFSYNHSTAYVSAVLAAARGYQGALSVPAHVPTDAAEGG